VLPPSNPRAPSLWHHGAPCLCLGPTLGSTCFFLTAKVGGGKRGGGGDAGSTAGCGAESVRKSRMGRAMGRRNGGQGDGGGEATGGREMEEGEVRKSGGGRTGGFFLHLQIGRLHKNMFI
jgi:hypothetical protein